MGKNPSAQVPLSDLEKAFNAAESFLTTAFTICKLASMTVDDDVVHLIAMLSSGWNRPFGYIQAVRHQLAARRGAVARFGSGSNSTCTIVAATAHEAAIEYAHRVLLAVTNADDPLVVNRRWLDNTPVDYTFITNRRESVEVQLRHLHLPDHQEILVECRLEFARAQAASIGATAPASLVTASARSAFMAAYAQGLHDASPKGTTWEEVRNMVLAEYGMRDLPVDGNALKQAAWRLRNEMKGRNKRNK